MRRALVSLPYGVLNVNDNDLNGQIGDGDSEVIRNVVTIYRAEKGYLLKGKQNIVPTIYMLRLLINLVYTIFNR